MHVARRLVAAAFAICTMSGLLATPGQAQDAPAARADPCAGKAMCENPGPFVAEVVQGSASMDRGYHNVRVVVRVRNPGAAPLVLGYVVKSGAMEDELGNRYEVDWRYREHVNGIGVVQPRSADTGFVLAPGASRNFTLTYRRYIKRSPAIGRSYSPGLTLAQLEPLADNQVRTVSEYSLNFTGLEPGGLAAAGDALSRALGDWLQRRQK